MRKEELLTMTVNELVSYALLLYMQGGKEQELEYVSRSENSQLGWYFWLKDVPGVYEIELKGYNPEANRDGTGKEDFYVRYYPALDEEVLESYSVVEQMIRFDKSIFDDSHIMTDLEDHEVCPCCAVPQKQEANEKNYETVQECEHAGHRHEHSHECHCGHVHEQGENCHEGRGHDHEHDEKCNCHEKHRHRVLNRRPKGIPNLLKKFDMNKKLFLIGELSVSVSGEGRSWTAELKTKKRLVERAKEAVLVEQNGKIIEVVEKNGVDRQVPGYKLSARFMEFFGGRVMATMAIGKPAVMLTEESEDVVPELCPNSDEASTKIIKYIQ